MRSVSLILPLSLSLLLAAALVLPSGAAARVLGPGDRGADVRALNERLGTLGYLPDENRSSTYDDATFQGVMAFQKWEGLTRDGVAGPRTKRALRDAERPRPRRAGSGPRIEVHLGRQVALLIRGGAVHRTIAVSTGAPGHDTPRGAFRVFRKELRSWSVPYKVWLPYASYFNGGIAFHEGESVPARPASHGCVRIPKPFSKEVYAFAAMKTRVDVV